MKKGGLDIVFHEPTVHYVNQTGGATIQIWPKVKNFSGYDIEVRRMVIYVGDVRFYDYCFLLKRGEVKELEFKKPLTEAEWKWFSSKNENKYDSGFMFVYELQYRSVLGEGEWRKSEEGKRVTTREVSQSIN